MAGVFHVSHHGCTEILHFSLLLLLSLDFISFALVSGKKIKNAIASSGLGLSVADLGLHYCFLSMGFVTNKMLCYLDGSDFGRVCLIIVSVILVCMMYIRFR